MLLLCLPASHVPLKHSTHARTYHKATQACPQACRERGGLCLFVPPLAAACLRVCVQSGDAASPPAYRLAHRCPALLYAPPTQPQRHAASTPACPACRCASSCSSRVAPPKLTQNTRVSSHLLRKLLAGELDLTALPELIAERRHSPQIVRTVAFLERTQTGDNQ